MLIGTILHKPVSGKAKSEQLLHASVKGDTYALLQRKKRHPKWRRSARNRHQKAVRCELVKGVRMWICKFVKIVSVKKERN
jgi:hypothetical protein